ncbi:hypothetical protein [Umezawaea sp. Da 62-37]|uniref:hypothetical protein n=1 Tax=Umezawaea sp. Da 62-37 TaxID=3075927 RepID=UPI0028F6E469|nr:hypothetical protein [Umezawaea sp. Da 62-37]WNV83057.1 hypothetical protein RM788_33365 [Umezawaea sp. Da 62-37]
MTGFFQEFDRRTAARAAADEFVAASQTNDPGAGLRPLGRMEITHGLAGVRDLAAEVLLILHRTCPPDLRTPRGGPDLSLLVPAVDDPFEVLAAAAHLSHAEDRDVPDASDISRIEHSVATATSARQILQAALDSITEQPDDTAGFLAAIELLAPLARGDVIATFPLLALAVRAAAPTAR